VEKPSVEKLSAKGSIGFISTFEGWGRAVMQWPKVFVQPAFGFLP